MIVSSLNHLKEVAKRANDCDRASFFIRLNWGARSSKDIGYYPNCDGWDVIHYISDSTENYDSTKDFLEGESFIIKALDKGALYIEEPLIGECTSTEVA